MVIVCFPGFELLDVSGPASVFGCASALSGGAGYRLDLCALKAGPVTSSCGITVMAKSLARVRGELDTLLVPGGLQPALRAARPLVPLLPALSKRARRTVAVCSGAFVLAEAGLLRGKRVTTHWAGIKALAARHPDLQVEADPIFVQDGNVWTSAGVTAGIDLCLALVEQDLGAELALEVARWGVMYLRRPGGQSQFSVPLAAQRSSDATIVALISWLSSNLQRELGIEVLARRAHMSVRNFSRVFRRETGKTPAAYVEELRLDAARRALELSQAPVKEIAVSCGFGSVESFQRVFRRALSVTPLQYRARFQILGRPKRHFA